MDHKLKCEKENYNTFRKKIFRIQVLDFRPKTQSRKGKSDTLDLSKIKNFCFVKDPFEIKSNLLTGGKYLQITPLTGDQYPENIKNS